MIRDRLRRGIRRLGKGLAKRFFDDDIQVDNTSVSQPILTAEPSAPPIATAVQNKVEPETEEDDPILNLPIHTLGPALTMDTVQALFEDMVRPALQADGGDIELVKVEDNNVFVRLTGACSTCPSSTITMKMGIERLLIEEFPLFQNLHQVPGHV